MSELFPRTTVGGVSLSRLIIGTNWFFGWSHTSHAKDSLIKSRQTRKSIADIIEVFLNSGVDTLMVPSLPQLKDIFADAQDRTGKKIIPVITPNFDVDTENLVNDELKEALDTAKELGAVFCMPHQCITDALTDKLQKKIRYFDVIAKEIRDRGMIPGLSTHIPESLIYADKTDLDVETYIQIYNAIGFLMPVEVDWIMRVIRNAKKPVMTIKPLAAGRLLPPVGLAYAWSTIRDCDMVTIGTYSPDEAREVIDLSLDFIHHRIPENKLQETRSKRSLK